VDGREQWRHAPLLFRLRQRSQDVHREKCQLGMLTPEYDSFYECPGHLLTSRSTLLDGNVEVDTHPLHALQSRASGTRQEVEDDLLVVRDADGCECQAYEKTFLRLERCAEYSRALVDSIVAISNSS